MIILSIYKKYKWKVNSIIEEAKKTCTKLSGERYLSTVECAR